MGKKELLDETTKQDRRQINRRNHSSKLENKEPVTFFFLECQRQSRPRSIIVSVVIGYQFFVHVFTVVPCAPSRSSHFFSALLTTTIDYCKGNNIMSDEKRKLVDSASIGSPPKKVLENIETIQLVIHNFKDRTEKRDEFIQSPVLKAHGYDWTILIYPKGAMESPLKTVHVSYVLQYAGGQEHKPAPAARIAIVHKGFTTAQSEVMIFDEETSPGSDAKRVDLLANGLEEDGSLKIRFDIQIASESKFVWYPKKLQQQEILTELYHEASDTADVVFNIGGMEYHAHKSILSRRAKTLFELSKDYNNDDNCEAVIPISDMRGEIFQKLLEFVYTVKTPEVKNVTAAIEVLLAANRFDCTELKLYMESVIVDKFLNPTIAVKMLILGDSYSCALLKEAAMNLCASDISAAKDSEGWSDLKESNRLLYELLESIDQKFISYRNDHDATTTATTVDNLDVTSLREQLQESKLEVDGSRSMLVERLKKHRHKQKLVHPYPISD